MDDSNTHIDLISSHWLSICHVADTVLAAVIAVCSFGCPGSHRDVASRAELAHTTPADDDESADAADAPGERWPCERSAADFGCRATEVWFCDECLPVDTVRVTCYRGRAMSVRGQTAMDLSPLACMSQLAELQLISGELEFIQTLKLDDLRPLAGLQTLETLRLGHTTVSDIRPLARLPRLRELSLHANPVGDIQPLAGLTSLRDLDLSGTDVVDLRPLARLEQLRRLDLTSTPVRDLSPLFHLSELRWLGLHGNPSLSQAQIAAVRANAPKVRITAGRTY